MTADIDTTTMKTGTHIKHFRPEPGVHLYVGKRSYTVTRLYTHQNWRVRDDEGWPLMESMSLKDCERFIEEREQ